ncbi:MAG: PQQ-dependent sugar dehydrogenase [Clostridiales bacterium]|nr:PQQ-dependent sugar dehydrogenase [Clostridiales bacterium]
MKNLLTKSSKLLCLTLSIVLLILVPAACGASPSDSETAEPTSEGSTTLSTAAPNPTETETQESTTALPTPIPLVLTEPFESAPPNTTYQPISDDQTRAPGVITQAEYSVTILTDELVRPWAIDVLPDGRFVITEKGGTLRIMTADGPLGEPIGGFPEVDDRSQGGLLDVAPAPDFSSSRMLYFTLAEATDQGSLTAVGRGRLSDDETIVENFEIVWRAIPYYDNSSHFGSRLEFDGEGTFS